jgi:hypothetical protein
VIGHILGGVDEAAEDDRVEAIEQQFLRGLLDQCQLPVLGAFQLLRAGREPRETAAVRAVALVVRFGVGPRRRVGGLDGPRRAGP